MTIADVVDFYKRRDLQQATGEEEPCAGCDTKLAAGASYSNYDLVQPKAPRAFPASMVLCQKCTYLVIGYRPPKPPV
jgi:hypothetical protein